MSSTIDRARKTGDEDPASVLSERSRLPRALVRAGLERPRSVLLAWALICLSATWGVLRLDVETSVDSVLDRTGSEWELYQDSLDRFGGDEIITILVEAPQPFASEALEDVVRLSESLGVLEGVRRVDSLSTVPLVRSGVGGDILLEPALAAGIPSTSEAIDAFAKSVRADRIAPGALVSEDGRFFAVNLVLERESHAHYADLLSSIDRELEGRLAHVSGVPVFRMEADARTLRELVVFVPLTIVAIGALLYLLFGSVGAVVIPLVASGLGTWVVLGVMGAVGVPVTITTVVLPSILLALGCAYCTHLLSTVASSDSDLEAVGALQSVALPVALSGLTTAIGFVAVSFVRIETIRFVGTFGAIGVVGVLAATLTAAPAMLRLWPDLRRPIRFHRWLRETAVDAIVTLVSRHRGTVLASWALAMLLVGLGIASVNVETDVILWFPEDDPIRAAHAKIRSELSGISPMNVVIKADGEAPVSIAPVIDAIDRLSAHLQALPEVGRAISVADPLRDLHGAFLDDPSDPLPDRSDAIAQYLILLQSKDYSRNLISLDRASANIMLRVDDNGSNALLGVAERARDWWDAHGVDGFSASTTGIMFEFARAEDEIAYGQLRGLAFALLAVAAVLLGIFRWPRLALISLIPNAIPISMAFGVMGLLGIPLDAGTVVLGSLALGIAVDDTIHVVDRFVHRRERGLTPIQALESSLRRALPAVCFTTIVVTLGFAILGISEFTVIRQLGLLTGGIMIVCLAADLLLLPALLIGFEAAPAELRSDSSHGGVSVPAEAGSP